jgi:hypothetical protein
MKNDIIFFGYYNSKLMECQSEMNEMHDDLCNLCKKSVWYIVTCALIITFSLVTITLGGYIVIRIDSESKVGWGLFQTGIILCLFISVFYLLPEFIRIVLNLLYPIRVKVLKTRAPKRERIVEHDIEMGHEISTRPKRTRDSPTGKPKPSPKIKGISGDKTISGNRERSNSNRSRSNSEIVKIKKIAAEIVLSRDPVKPVMIDNPMRA